MASSTVLLTAGPLRITRRRSSFERHLSNRTNDSGQGYVLLITWYDFLGLGLWGNPMLSDIAIDIGQCIFLPLAKFGVIAGAVSNHCRISTRRIDASVLRPPPNWQFTTMGVFIEVRITTSISSLRSVKSGGFSAVIGILLYWRVMESAWFRDSIISLRTATFSGKTSSQTGTTVPSAVSVCRRTLMQNKRALECVYRGNTHLPPNAIDSAMTSSLRRSSRISSLDAEIPP